MNISPEFFNQPSYQDMYAHSLHPQDRLRFEEPYVSSCEGYNNYESHNTQPTIPMYQAPPLDPTLTTTTCSPATSACPSPACSPPRCDPCWTPPPPPCPELLGPPIRPWCGCPPDFLVPRCYINTPYCDPCLVPVSCVLVDLELRDYAGCLEPACVYPPPVCLCGCFPCCCPPIANYNCICGCTPCRCEFSGPCIDITKDPCCFPPIPIICATCGRNPCCCASLCF